MAVTQISKIYAQSLLDLNLDNNLIKSELQNIIETFTDELFGFFANPTISVETKVETLDEIFKDKINSELYKFLGLLVENERITLLPEIYESFSHKLNEADNILDVEIISSISLEDSLKQRILEKLSSKLNKTIEANWVVSDDIIAGLVIKIGDNIIDTSLQNKLDNLSKFIK